METKKICIKEVNENLRLIKLGEPLTRSLKELNCNCEFKNKYNEWCDIQDGIEKFVPKELNCIICKNKFKQRYHNQVCCSKKCSKDKIKAYREANKDKIAEKGKAYREANKDKIKAYYEAYYEANKDKIKAYYEAYYEANKDKIKAYYEANKDTRTKQQRMRDAWEKSEHDMSKLQKF